MPVRSGVTMPLEPGIIDALVDIVGPQHVRLAQGEPAVGAEAHPLFHAIPDAVVYPANTAEIAAILRGATACEVPVIPRGGRSTLCAVTIPASGGIVLALSRMNRILEISGEDMLARVQPGVTTTRLAEAAAAMDLRYATERSGRATIGGTVAVSAGGLWGRRYGGVADRILGLEAVLPTGEVIYTGGGPADRSLDYDLTRLLTGSEGTLAVITEVILALHPTAADGGTGVATFATLDDAGQAISAIIGAGILPPVFEILDHTCIEAIEDVAGLGLRREAAAVLVFGDDGTPGTITAHRERIGDLCTMFGALDVSYAPGVARSRDLLAARRCSLPALTRLGSTAVSDEVRVPRTRLAEMMGRVGEIGDRGDVLIASFGHAGDGALHVTCLLEPGDQRSARRAQDALADIFLTALELGGTISGGCDVPAPAPFAADRIGIDQIRVLRKLKSAFDPAGILNPGKRA